MTNKIKYLHKEIRYYFNIHIKNNIYDVFFISQKDFSEYYVEIEGYFEQLEEFLDDEGISEIEQKEILEELESKLNEILDK